MRLLVLGGTVFLGWTVAAEAVRRGHDVVCAARGTSGAIPDGAELVTVDRDDSDGLAPLAGRGFDAVVDVARISRSWVRDALRMLGPTAAHWTFVSTISVYADHSTVGQTTTAPLVEPLAGDRGTPSDELYGATKAASENAVRDALGDRAFVVRPGLITGPKDGSDRFGYWPARLSQGGRVAVPDVPGLLTQYIDVRDLAKWIIDAGERRLVGTFDAVGTPEPLGDLLSKVAALVAPPGTELVPVADDVLAANEINPWSGARSLPLWLPDTHHGMCAHDVTASLAAGLAPRHLADAVAGALEHERALGIGRERDAGLTPSDEQALLGIG